MMFIASFSTQIAAETFIDKLPVYLHLIYRRTDITELKSDIVPSHPDSDGLRRKR